MSRSFGLLSGLLAFCVLSGCGGDSDSTKPVKGPSSPHKAEARDAAAAESSNDSDAIDASVDAGGSDSELPRSAAGHGAAGERADDMPKAGMPAPKAGAGGSGGSSPASSGGAGGAPAGGAGGETQASAGHGGGG
ncbi:MAG TPA: hypothetical protein VJV78_34520, partial [Polyangiales bacterium]|nr:hypothetical protein [Polyangiales bacterium]